MAAAPTGTPGTVLITGPNVVWAGDLKVDPIQKKGGKK